jgi:hypothetical protein
MIVFNPIRLIRPLICLVLLVFLTFLAGFVMGGETVLLLAVPRLMERKDLIGIPVALISVWMMFWLSRQLLRKDVQESGKKRTFSRGGLLAGFVFLLMLLPFAAGLWFGQEQGGLERERRVVAAGKPANKGGTVKIVAAPHSNPAPPPPGVTVVEARESGLRLNAVFYGTTKPSAVINGEYVYIGEHIREWSVMAIGPGDVTVQNGRGRTSTLVIGDR